MLDGTLVDLLDFRAGGGTCTQPCRLSHEAIQYVRCRILFSVVIQRDCLTYGL